MAATKPTNNSTNSQWPNVDKAAFWKENKTTMKIVKIIVTPIFLPLAFVSDLVNKTINYAWSLKDVKVCSIKPKIDLKGHIQAGKTKVKNLWNNHMKKIITAATIGLASVGLYYLFSYVKPFACQRVCLENATICNTKTGECHPFKDTVYEINF